MMEIISAYVRYLEATLPRYLKWHFLAADVAMALIRRGLLCHIGDQAAHVPPAVRSRIAAELGRVKDADDELDRLAEGVDLRSLPLLLRNAQLYLPHMLDRMRELEREVLRAAP